MLKKVLIIILVTLVILVGGIVLLLNTKSDFILDKVSSVVEEATGAPLTMEALPSLSFFPPSVELGKASWGTEELFIKFQSARVHFSLTELLEGNFSLAEVALDGLDLVYDATKENAKEADSTGKTTTESVEDDVEAIADDKGNEQEESVASSIESAFMFLPQNVSLTNSTINYKDATQNVLLTNFNIVISDLALNEKSNASFNSTIEYIDPSTAQDVELDYDISLDFVLSKSTLSLDMHTFKIQPKKGLDFTEAVTASTQMEFALDPFDVKKMTAQVKSSLAELEITQKGELNENSFGATINASFYPRTIVKTFDSTTSLPETKDIDTVSLSTDVFYKDNVFTMQNFQTTVGDGIIKSTSFVYDQKADTITGDISMADFVLDSFVIEQSSEESATQSTSQNTETADQTNSTTSDKIEFPTELQKTKFDIAINLSNIRYENTVLESLTTKLQGQNAKLSLNDLIIKTLGSVISSQVTADFGTAQSASLNISIPSMDLNTWNKALTGDTSISGTAKVETKLSFPMGDPISNLNGSGQIDLANGTVDSNVIPMIAKILVTSKVTDHNFEFADGKVPFTLDKSVLTLNKAYVNSSKFYVTTSGTVNLLTEALNLTAEAGKGENSSLIIPVSIKGTISDPKVSISLSDTTSIVTTILDSTVSTDLSTVNEKIDETLSKGINSSFSKLFGK